MSRLSTLLYVCVSVSPLWLSGLSPSSVASQERDAKVRDDRRQFSDDAHWVYNDLPRGLAEARKAGKPLLVVFR